MCILSFRYFVCLWLDRFLNFRWGELLCEIGSDRRWFESDGRKSCIWVFVYTLRVKSRLKVLDSLWCCFSSVRDAFVYIRRRDRSVYSYILYLCTYVSVSFWYWARFPERFGQILPSMWRWRKEVFSFKLFIFFFSHYCLLRRDGV